MARHIPFPTHLTQKDIELNDALHTAESNSQQTADSTETTGSDQYVLAQQVLKQLLAQVSGIGCPVDPNIEWVYFPEDGFVPQERYL